MDMNRTSMRYIFFGGIMIWYALVAHDATANGFGVALDKPVGDYVVNVDYDAVSGIYAGDPVQFAFQIFNKDRSEQLDFDNVWVSITPETKSGIFARPAFDGGIMGSTFPPSGMTFAFPASGSYTLNLRYEKGDKTLAEAGFPLDVKSGEGDKGNKGFFSFSGDFLKGALSVMLVGIVVFVGRMLFGKKETT